jgi:hypothetical protein
MFNFLACKKVLIKGNQLKGDVLGKNIQLKQMTNTDVIVKPDNTFTMQQ